MNKYHVQHQKNVYFIDLDKKLYRGYVETTVELSKKIEFVEYLVGGLEIDSVDAKYAREYARADYKCLSPDTEKFKQSYDSGFYREVPQKQKLIVYLKGHPGEVKVRVTYRSKRENLSICFYEKDPHKECIGQNINFRSHFVFPNIVSESGYPFDFFYIVPENCTVVSPGKLVGTAEQKGIIIHTYTLQHAFPGNINFAVGTFDLVEIISGDDTKAIYIPLRHKESKVLFKENAKDIVQDLLGCIRFIETFLDIEYPPISIIFTLSPSRYLVGHNTFITNASLLPFNNSVDQNFIFREAVSKILVSQLFLNLKDPGYIKSGITGYMEDTCIRHFFGNNEVLLRLKKEKDFVVKNDVRELSLDDTRRCEFSMDQSFFKLKSKLFIHLLENNLSEAFMQRILVSLRSKGCIRTDGFIKLIKNIAGKDMSEVFRIYVSKPGSVVFNCTFQIDQSKNKVTFSIKQKPTSVMENSNRKFLGNVYIRVFEIEGVFEHSYNLCKSELVFYYHTRTKKTKKKESEPLMPLLWVRIDPKGEYLAGVELKQPDFMFMEAIVHEKSVVGQYEALRALEKKPSEQTCNVLERVLNDTHIFYKIRMEAAFVLSQIFLENYDGYQKAIQFFVKKYCLQGSTIIKPNEFSNFTSYFIQAGLIRAIALSFPLKCRSVNEKDITVRDVAIAFINNILLYNDNDTNTYEDSFYISNAIESLSFPLCSQNIEKKCSEDTRPGSFLEEMGLEHNFNKEYLGLKADISNIGAEIVNIVISNKFGNALNLSIELIEKYRKFDLISPSISNKVTTSCLQILGKLYLYGYVELDKEVLLQYTIPKNFISVRLASLELLLLMRNKEIMAQIFDILKYEHYTIKLHTIVSIKNLISASILDFNDFFSEFRDEFYDLLGLFSFEFVLFKHLADVIFLIEKKGKVVEDIEEVNLHELSDEEVLEEAREQGKHMRGHNSTLIVLKVPRSAERYVYPSTGNQSIAGDAENEGCIVRLKVPQKVNRKEAFLVDVEKRLQGARNKDSKSFFAQDKLGEYTVSLKSKERKDILVSEMLFYENTYKIDGFIKANRDANDFFSFRPFTISEVCDKNSMSWWDVFNHIYASMAFVLTFERFGSKVYASAKHCILHLENLFLKIGGCDIFDELTEKKKKGLLEIINEVISDEDSEPFLEDVDYKKLRLLKYVDIVRLPLSLLKVKNKLLENQYRNYSVAIFELKKILINCLMFNQKGSGIYISALKLLKKIGLFLEEDTESSVFFPLAFYKEPVVMTRRALNELLFELIEKLESRENVKEAIWKILYDGKTKMSAYIDKVKRKLKRSTYLSLGHFLEDLNLLAEICVRHNSAQQVRVCRMIYKDLKFLIVIYFGEDTARIFFGQIREIKV